MLNTTRTMATGTVTKRDANVTQAIESAHRQIDRALQGRLPLPMRFHIRDANAELVAFVGCDANGKRTTIAARSHFR